MNFKVGMVSLGCEKNRVDAEMLLHSLRERGFTLVEDVADADVAIVNTCGFIESAKQESIEEIIELGKLKDEGKIKKIIAEFRENGFNITREAILHNYKAWRYDMKSGYRDEENNYHLFSPCGCNPLSFRATTLHKNCADWQHTYTC